MHSLTYPALTFEILFLFLLYPHLKSTTHTTHRLAVWLHIITALLTSSLLILQHTTPSPVWQDMVSPGPHTNQPRGMRTFSTVFWVLSWALLLVPLANLKLMLQNPTHPGSISLQGLRNSMLYAVLHFLPVAVLFAA